MGCHANIGYGKWPEQGLHLGQRVEVVFDFGEERLTGTVVRDDLDDPYVTIIKLDCGRHVLASECQYRTIGQAPTPSGSAGDR